MEILNESANDIVNKNWIRKYKQNLTNTLYG